jgi:hypothetical protein
MARVGINYPAPEPVAVAPTAPAAPVYQDPATKNVRNSIRFPFFGLPSIPIGPGRQVPLYDPNDPAARALYGMDDPNRNQPQAQATPGGTPATAAPVRTPVSSYGENNTGRTTPFAPNPTYANRTTLPMGGPVYPNGSGSPSGQGGGAAPAGQSNDPFSGFLGGLLSLLTGKKPGAGGDGEYEAALRERPDDIQRLVSMTKNPTGGTNAGGFLGGLFDEKKG